MSLKGTETEKNLLKAFAGESQARNKYTYFASVAKNEGYEQISAIFLETADNEKEHAKRFFKFLEGGMLELTVSYPAGRIGTTIDNLSGAAGGEHEEWSILYPAFAKTARKEGFEDVAVCFEEVSVAEKAHEERYTKLLGNIQDSQVYSKKTSVVWKCRNCGYVKEGKSAPDLCPACLHAKKYFEIKEENY
jgi:rubrerythrin